MEIGDESSCQEINTVFHENHFALILPRPCFSHLELISLPTDSKADIVAGNIWT